jgi:hypothetical protein
MQDRKTSTLQHHRMLEGELGRLSLSFGRQVNGEGPSVSGDPHYNFHARRAQQALLQNDFIG